MTGPSETFLNEFFDEGRLVELEREIEGTLCCIAFADKTKISFIERRVKGLERDYREFFNELGGPYNWIGLQTLQGFSVYNSLMAFEDLTSEEWRDLSPFERAERATEILGQYGFWGFSPEDISENVIYR